MPVYNVVPFDGRVQRAAIALSRVAEVTVVGAAGPTRHVFPDFRLEEVALDQKHGMTRLLKFWTEVLKISRRLRPDVVYAHDFYLSLAGLAAAVSSKARFIYDAHELIVPAQGEKNSMRLALFRRMEAAAIGKADIVIAANRERATVMQRHYGLAQIPVVVRNIAPAPSRRPVVRPRPVNSNGPVRLVYQGNISYERGLRSFFEAMVLLGSSYELFVVGAGPDEATARDFVRSHPEANIVMVGRVPRDELHTILGQCDIGIVTYPYNGLNNIYCAPNKTYEYAQAGIPMLVTGQPPLRAVVETFGIGRIVSRAAEGSSPSPESIALEARMLAANLDTYKAHLGPFLAANTWEDEQETLVAAVSDLI